ncbi:N-acetylmuramoyl-L-alanine amidase family protein [Desulforamulus aeronauticus]|uniref:N-acetylmuramoyl-L-alanine amidase n=1 Tax=Desulforamulus aeronauticus DSM 10349 TaxID=1121421 RepID=A0A1M6SH72_9FIRM|nr:N-acetylmuramoyl-L-alanine amidase family protein [Desulforamulus aeronauticus]SHK43999.1 N-acetylmuramoyl-L-alanine amidase [Desulforamulus aeronauticus DSM 10349]
MKKRYLLSGLLILCWLFSFPVAGLAKEPALVINDKVVKTDVSPQIIDGRMMIPLRVVSESLGAKVNWLNQEKTVTIEANQKTLKLKVNTKIAYVNDQSLTIDAPPKLIQNRTFVPLRFIGENLDSDVIWDQEKYQAIIKAREEKIDNSYLPTPNEENTNSEEPSSEEPNPENQVQNPRVLTKAEYQENEDQTIINLWVESGQHKVTELTNPDRLVIDLSDTSKGVDGEATVNTKHVSTMRVGQFTPTTTRVVLELKGKVSYQLNQSANLLNVVLVPKTTSDNSSSQQPGEGYVHRVINDNNIIVVDAGHGGKDSGGVGISGRYEKDITLPTALKLKTALESRGFQVEMTRSDDTFLELMDIVNITNRVNPFAFVSIHANKAGNPSVTGVETYTFYGTDHTLADLVQSSIISKTQQVDRKVKEAGFVVIKYTQVPSILVETGFISNQGEEDFLFDPNNQTQIAEAIAEGVAKFKEIQNKTLTSIP